MIMKENENDLNDEISKFEITATTQHATNLKGTEKYGRRKRTSMPALKQQTKSAAVQQCNLVVRPRNKIKPATVQHRNSVMKQKTEIKTFQQLNSARIEQNTYVKETMVPHNPKNEATVNNYNVVIAFTGVYNAEPFATRSEQMSMKTSATVQQIKSNESLAVFAASKKTTQDKVVTGDEPGLNLNFPEMTGVYLNSLEVTAVERHVMCSIASSLILRIVTYM